MVKIKLIKKDERDYAILFLRLGLAFAFFYAAISSFLNPAVWFGFFPEFVRTLLLGNFILTIFSIGEVFIGLWLLSNYKIYYAAIVSAFIMVGIIAFNLGALYIVFRDVTIFFSSVALAVLTKNLR